MSSSLAMPRPPKKKPARPPQSSFFPICAQKMIPKPTTTSIRFSSQTISADPSTFNCSGVRTTSWSGSPNFKWKRLSHPTVDGTRPKQRCGTTRRGLPVLAKSFGNIRSVSHYGMCSTFESRGV